MTRNWKTICHLLLALLLASSSGCSEQAPPQNPPAPTAITLDQWKLLPVPEKYDEGTFERLRMNDPKLKSDRAWRSFMIKEIIPERKKDIPIPPGTLPPNAEGGFSSIFTSTNTFIAESFSARSGLENGHAI